MNPNSYPEYPRECVSCTKPAEYAIAMTEGGDAGDPVSHLHLSCRDHIEQILEMADLDPSNHAVPASWKLQSTDVGVPAAYVCGCIRCQSNWATIGPWKDHVDLCFDGASWEDTEPQEAFVPIKRVAGTQFEPGDLVVDVDDQDEDKIAHARTTFRDPEEYNEEADEENQIVTGMDAARAFGIGGVAVVMNVSPNPATHVALGDKTIADLNPAYCPADQVVEIAFIGELDGKVTKRWRWEHPDSLIPWIETFSTRWKTNINTYSYPTSRLEYLGPAGDPTSEPVEYESAGGPGSESYSDIFQDGILTDHSSRREPKIIGETTPYERFKEQSITEPSYPETYSETLKEAREAFEELYGILAEWVQNRSDEDRDALDALAFGLSQEANASPPIDTGLFRPAPSARDELRTPVAHGDLADEEEV